MMVSYVKTNVLSSAEHNKVAHVSRKIKLNSCKDLRNTGKVQFSATQKKKKILIFKYIHFGFKVINPSPCRKIHTEKEIHSAKETKLIHAQNSEYCKMETLPRSP